MEQNALAVGDTFRLNVELYGKQRRTGLRRSRAAFDYFPTWYPGGEEAKWLFVGNLDNLYEQAGDQYPYDVWLRTDGKQTDAEMDKTAA